jgi:hypothetical protein
MPANQALSTSPLRISALHLSGYFEPYKQEMMRKAGYIFFCFFSGTTGN